MDYCIRRDGTACMTDFCWAEYTYEVMALGSVARFKETDLHRNPRSCIYCNCGP